MKITICICSIALFLLLSLTLETEETDNQDKLKQIIRHNLAEIEDSYIQLLNFDQRRRAIQLVDEIITIIENKYVLTPESPYNVLSDEAFLVLKDQVEKTISANSKTKYILAIGKKGFITTEQLLILLKSYTFDSDIIDCIKKVYPHLLDKVNSAVLLSTINSTHKKDELAEWMAIQ